MKDNQPAFWFIFWPSSRDGQFVCTIIVNYPSINCIIFLVIPLKFVLYLSHGELPCIGAAMEMFMPGVIRWLEKLREIHKEMAERLIAGDAVSLFYDKYY